MQGKIPDPLPEEAEIQESIKKLKSRTIEYWPDQKIDEFMRKMSKSQSVEQIDRKVEEFIKNNNCVMTKMARKRVGKILFNISKNNSANLQLLPSFARFVAIINQYFPEIGVEITSLLQNEFTELQSFEQNDLINYDVKIRNIRF